MIREVTTPQGIEVVVALAQEIWHEYFPGVISTAQVEYMLNRFLSAEEISRQIASGYGYYLISRDSVNEGFFAVVPEKGNSLFLSKLYVLKASRGRGLASEGMAFIESLCRAQGRERLWLRVNIHNKPAIEVYQHMGFLIEDSLMEDIGGGFVMDDYIMVKRF